MSFSTLVRDAEILGIALRLRALLDQPGVDPDLLGDVLDILIEPTTDEAASLESAGASDSEVQPSSV